MTRRDLFKFLSVVPAAPLALEGELIRPFAERRLPIRKGEEYNYGRIEFSGPALMKPDLVRNLRASLEGLNADLIPLPQVLAEDGQKIWHAGWLDLNGCIWNRSEVADKFTAVLAIYSRADTTATVAYNRCRLVRGLFDRRIEAEALVMHTRLLKARAS